MSDLLFIAAQSYRQLMNYTYTITINKKCFNAVSLFPSDKLYNDDGKIRTEQYQLLSIKETTKLTNISTTIFEVPKEELLMTINQIKIANLNSTITNDIKSLKSKRKKYIENPSVGNQNKYEKQLSIFNNKNIYSNEMILEVINRLNDQLSSTTDEKYIEIIKSELKNIQI